MSPVRLRVYGALTRSKMCAKNPFHSLVGCATDERNQEQSWPWSISHLKPFVGTLLSKAGECSSVLNRSQPDFARRRRTEGTACIWHRSSGFLYHGYCAF